MKILVINSGSSSIKFALFDTAHKNRLLMKGVVERIGEKQFPNHCAAMEALFDQIGDTSIDGIGHRVVHGGEAFREPTLIDGEVIKQIKKVGRFVPLHVEPNLIGIEVSQKRFPSLPQVAVFDTAAYEKLPMKAFLYGIPPEFYEQHQIRRYGFHGINHSYVAEEAAKLLGKKELKLISCHLGSGCSITPFENGIALDNSMGLTPLEGVVMGTRSGDLDPSIILYLIDALGFTTQQITDLLNKKSGLLGLSGKNDIRDIHVLAKNGDRWAQVALEIFVYRIQKYIGAYIAVLKGVDALVFTGGIGENDPTIRERVVSNFSYMGAFVEKEKNQGQAAIFSTDSSKVVLLNIAANEELVIAEQTNHLLQQKRSDHYVK